MADQHTVSDFWRICWNGHQLDLTRLDNPDWQAKENRANQREIDRARDEYQLNRGELP